MYSKKPFTISLLAWCFSMFFAPFSVLAGPSSASGLDGISGLESLPLGIHSADSGSSSRKRNLNFSGWGSSSVERIAPHFSEIIKELDPRAKYYNGGKGGELSSQTTARLGSMPLRVNVVSGRIPPSGSVRLLALNVKPSDSWEKYEATMSGIRGEVSATHAGIKFTRHLPGTEVAGSQEVVPIEGPKHRSDIVLLWMGKHDITSGYEVSGIAARIGRTCYWLRTHDGKCLIIGNFNDSDAEVDGVKQKKLAALNALLAQEYGDLFIDVQSLLVLNNVWALSRINPTPADLESQRNGQKPPSLSQDNGHMNTAAYNVVRRMVQKRIEQLGW